MSEWAESDLANAGRVFAGVVAVLRREYALFAMGIGVVAIHIVDDNYLQPEPGTSTGDHLASGLIPLGVLAVVAILYPHMRAGGARQPR